MLQFDLTAQVRNNFGKEASRRLRASGQTPAILYGNNTAPVALMLNTKDLTNTMLKVQRRNAIFNLQVTGQDQEVTHPVMVKEMQTDPLTDALVHADFYAVPLEKPMVFIVPVTYVGKPKGVDLGGDLTIFIRTITLKGRPLDIPEFVEKDISDMDVDTKLTCAELTIPDSVELISDPATVCASVSKPVQVTVVEEAPVTKGKKKK